MCVLSIRANADSSRLSSQSGNLLQGGDKVASLQCALLRGGHFRVISVTRCRCVSLLNLEQAYCTHPSTTCVQYACSQLFSKPVSRLLISQTVYIMFNANKMKWNLDIRRTQIFWKVDVCRLSIFARKPQHDNICYMRKIHVQYQNIPFLSTVYSYASQPNKEQRKNTTPLVPDTCDYVWADTRQSMYGTSEGFWL